MTIYDAHGLHTGNGAAMRTFTGRHVDPFTMTADDVVPADIVHSLAYQCRYNGHSKGWLSVARHSIHVSDWLEAHGHDGDMLLAGLLHDAAEAYIGDLIRPLKHRPEFQFFRELDERVTAVILERFGVGADNTGPYYLHPWKVLPEIIHEADNAITMSEVNFLRHREPYGFWTPASDEQEFRNYLADHRPEDFR